MTRRGVRAGALLLAALGFGYGYLSRSLGLFPDRLLSPLLPRAAPKDSGPTRAAAAKAESKDDDRREREERLMALGYLPGYSPPFERSGVVTHDAARVSPGFNLVVSGHEPSALLVDMEGRVRHRWAKSVGEAWPRRKVPEAEQYRTRHWKRARLLPNGDLLVLFEGFGLIKLDRDSRVLWTYSDRVHHDLDFDAQGNILVLAWREQQLVHPKRRILGDVVAVLSPEGRRTGEISVLRALEDSRWAALARHNPNTQSDLLHTNTLSLLDGRHARAVPAFRAGNLLVAVRNLDFIGVIDPETGRFVWGLAGMWHQPHEPVLLPNGHLLVFDNYSHRSGGDYRSLALELDPVTQEVVWSFGGSEPGFFSKVVGLVQRLPNGNTLITSSTEGRVLEVTARRELVWEFRNPHEVVDGGQAKAATLFDVVRVTSAHVSWLGPAAPPDPP